MEWKNAGKCCEITFAKMYFELHFAALRLHRKGFTVANVAGVYCLKESRAGTYSDRIDRRGAALWYEARVPEKWCGVGIDFRGGALVPFAKRHWQLIWFASPVIPGQGA